jgi:hypothetical protein
MPIGAGLERKENNMSFKIDDDKLRKVTEIVNAETDPAATEELIKSEICADWNEGKEHQEWIDNASPQEIADWLASFYGDN